MRSQITALVLFLIITVLFHPLTAGEESVAQRNFKELAAKFADPPPEFRSAPLWVWNDDVTESEIDKQLAELKAGGMGGVFIHPRPGLVTPYLSERWFELCKYTVDKARELGLLVWLYDENSYPSGFAGGNVPAEMPESYNQGQGLVMKKLITLPEGADYFIILQRTESGFKNITDQSPRPTEPGPYYVFEKSYYKKSPWHGGYSYVDLLLKGVTEKFIDVTMTGYEKAIGDEFGNLVPGIFTDEPNINPPAGTKWTPDLFEAFRSRWGYDLVPHLPSLFEEVDDWKKVRHNYYSLLLDLFIERWSKPWHDYCEKHNLKWTGHYWEHGWPGLADGADNMAMYAWHQVPAIDLLMNQYNEGVNAQFGNVRIVRELASVANQMGRNRTLSETYGAGGWDLRFEDMKRIGDWEYVLGVNFLNQHLSYITIEGARKRDHPLSFSYHEPWWSLYHYSGDYFGRLSLALSSGEQVNRVLVLEPTTTAWLYYSPSKSNPDFQTLGPAFQKFVLDLEKYQIEYDLGSEYIIQTFGKVTKNQFIVGKRSYDVVVLPSTVENLNSEVVELLDHYLKGGGKVLSFSESIGYVDGEATERIKKLAATHTAGWIQCQNISDAAVLDNLTSDQITFNDPQKSGGKLFHQRRQLDDGNLLFLVNTSNSEWSSGEFSMVGGSMKELDLTSGKIGDYPFSKSGDKISAKFDLPPCGSLLLFAGKLQGRPQPLPHEGQSVILEPRGSMQVKREKPNILTLDYCDLLLDNRKYEEMYFFNAADMVFRSFGFEGNPWSTSVQFRTAILNRNHFPEDSGFSADFIFAVEEGVNLGSLRAVVERPELWRVFINGRQVTALPNSYWLDRSFGVYPIGDHVVAGKNLLTLEAQPMTVHTELEPVYILGDFALRSQEKGWKITPAKPLKAGSWADQGMPFYGDKVSYTQSYRVRKSDKRYIVKLTDWEGSVAQVFVNGVDAGIIGWPPYELDVTDLVTNGRNEIAVEVYGTLKNTLGPHHIGKVRGTAWPHSFQSAPPKWPAGSDYDTIDYGLFRDFVLLEYSGPEQRVYWRNYKTAAPAFIGSQTIFPGREAVIQIENRSPGAEIRYTLDGSDPSAGSQIYSGPIKIDRSATVKARSFKEGEIESDVIQRTIYLVDKQKNGINYEYYEGGWEDIPDFSPLTPKETGRVFQIGFEGINRRHEAFAIRFTGFLQIDANGEYTFALNSNDGSRLFIDDKLVVDNGGNHGMQERQGIVNLEKGLHSIRVEYFDAGGSQGLEAYIAGPGISKQIIPPDKLLWAK